MLILLTQTAPVNLLSIILITSATFGEKVGIGVGSFVGSVEGSKVGSSVGSFVGKNVGITVGIIVGWRTINSNKTK